MRDLSLGDATQRRIIEHLEATENLLAAAASKASGRRQDAEIWLLPDLGLPNNVRRIHGGFFTGALYNWQTTTPIVPVDATVNVCTVSVFKLCSAFASQHDFTEQVEFAIKDTFARSSYVWNFNQGNHFVTYGHVSGSASVADGHYLVLHSSASEYKRQDNGLYPVPGNWFMPDVKVLHDPFSARYLRYIEGQTAERFYQIASMLEKANQLRHEFFADLIAGEHNIEKMVFSKPHYGMPAPHSIAIGCQWLSEPSLFLLLTGPDKPLYFVQTELSERNKVALGDDVVQLYPHGLGKRSDVELELEYKADGLKVNGTEYPFDASLADGNNLSLRTIEGGAYSESIPPLVQDILSSCPGKVVGTLLPIYSYSHDGFSGIKACSK